jgi:hypothetical protein
MFWSRALALPGLCLLFASQALAQDAGSQPGQPGRDWMLVLSALTDERDYESLLGGFYLALADDTWLSFAAGQSRAPSTEQEVRAGLVSLGVEHDFGPLGFGLSADRWGDANNLESLDWRGEVFVERDRFRVGLTREARSIDIYFSGDGEPILTDLRSVGIDADGFGIDWRVRLAPAWRVYGNWADYDYPRRVRVVPRADRLDLLSTSAVTLAYSFVDRYQRIGIERSFGFRLVSFDYSQDRSTIASGRIRSLAASVLWPVAPRFDVEFRLGSSRADGFGSSVYGGLSLLIYGDG